MSVRQGQGMVLLCGPPAHSGGESSPGPDPGVPLGPLALSPAPSEGTVSLVDARVPLCRGGRVPSARHS